MGAEGTTGVDDTLVRLEGVTKVFQAGETETRALSAIDLAIARGEVVTVSGPSGCGKSTLLSILGLLDTPTSGHYFLKQREVDRLDPTEQARIRNREIGFIFQSFNLVGALTVFENVELPLTYRGISRTERRKRVADVLARVGMSARRD